MPYKSDLAFDALFWDFGGATRCTAFLEFVIYGKLALTNVLYNPYLVFDQEVVRNVTSVTNWQ